MESPALKLDNSQLQTENDFSVSVRKNENLVYDQMVRQQGISSLKRVSPGKFPGIVTWFWYQNSRETS